MFISPVLLHLERTALGTRVDYNPLHRRDTRCKARLFSILAGGRVRVGANQHQKHLTGTVILFDTTKSLIPSLVVFFPREMITVCKGKNEYLTGTVALCTCQSR
jgi:hypothetical protein